MVHARCVDLEVQKPAQIEGSQIFEIDLDRVSKTEPHFRYAPGKEGEFHSKMVRRDATQRRKS